MKAAIHSASKIAWSMPAWWNSHPIDSSAATRRQWLVLVEKVERLEADLDLEFPRECEQF
jgi:hypothetical protein